jgi:hypothetical protein
MSPKEGYQPSPQEMKRAEDMMKPHERNKTERREVFARGLDMELVKKCFLILEESQFRGSRRDSIGTISGTIDGVVVKISFEKGQWSAKVNDVAVDAQIAEELWSKFYPVVTLIEQNNNTSIEKSEEREKATALRLLEL